MTRRLLLLLAATLAAKAAVLAQIGSHPLLQPLGDIDSGVYARLAARIAGGDLLLRGEGPVPYFVSPLYAYFLAATGPSFAIARVVQILLGTAAVGLVFLTAKRLFGGKAALPAGALFALAGVVSFHEVLILQAAIDPFLTALALFLLARAVAEDGGKEEEKSSLKVKRRKGEEEAREKERDEEKIALKVKRGGARAGGGAEWGAFVAAGAAFGLLCLNRPNVLLCVAFVAGAIVLSPLVARGPSAARGPSSSFEENLRPLRPLAIAMVFVAGAVLTIAPVALRNLLVSREFVLVSSHGGLNFLVGNGTGASGAYRTLPGITPDIAGQAADTKRVAEAEEGRTLSTREVSAHFARKAWSWIAHEPAAAFSLFLRKIRLTLSEDEAPLNFSFPWYRERSTALKVLRVGPGLLVPLAGAGFILAFLASADAARRALLVWSVFVPSYVVAVAAFFVATRYRLPLLVALAPLAGAAVAEIPAALRAGRRRALAGALATAVVLGAVSLWPTGLWNGAADEEMHLVLWEIESGEPGAMAHAEAAAAAHPDPALVWLRVGRSFEAAGKLDDAITSLSRSRELGPQRGASLLLAGLLEKRGLQRVGSGDLAGGRADLEEAVRLDAASAPARLNLAVACAMAGETERARGLAREALALQPGYAKAEAFLKALR